MFAGDAARRPGGPSRNVPAHRPCAAGPRDGQCRRRSQHAGSGLGPQRWIGGLPIREERQGCLKWEVHRGRCGANLKTPRAGRLGNGGLAAACRKAGHLLRLGAARCRGLRVRSDPWRPARPRHSRAGGLSRRSPKGGGGRSWECGSPRADQRIGAMMLARLARRSPQGEGGGRAKNTGDDAWS